MALIGKIRNNMWFVFIIIALALLSFILMDAMGPGGGGPTMNTAVGEVAGEKISNTEFESAYRSLFSNSQDPNASRAALWNYFVEQKVVNKESEDLGLNIGYDELMDLQFGSNLSPIVYQNFINPSTGQLDISQLQQIKQQIESGAQLAPQLAQFWKEQEKQIIKAQLQTKLSSLAQKAVYTPNWMAQVLYSEENGTADVAVVKIPFDNIPTNDITVKDADILNYIKENKQDFEIKEEKRVVDFVTMKVYPTPLDSAKNLASIMEVINNFSTAEDDSLFASINNGFYSNFYAKAEEIDEIYLNELPAFEIGKVYGPYNIGSSYQAVKLIDKKTLPDSVRASHILRRATAANPTQMAAAEAMIDSLLEVVQSKKTPFDTLAVKFSEDLSNNKEGGDLGYFVQGAMVAPFNDVAFITGKEGGYYKVKTQFGVHLLYIADQKYLTNEPKYKLAYANVPIVPSKETQNSLYEVMVELVSAHPYLDDLRNAVDKIGNLSMQSSDDLSRNDYIISTLTPGNTSRDMVKWAFDKETSVNDVSPVVYQFQDPIQYYNNAYVLVGLSKIKSPGMPKVEDVRSKVEFAVLNKLKGEAIIKTLNTGNLSSVASQYNTKVDTIRNVNLLNTFVGGLGNEPAVIGEAFGQAVGQISKPILGNSGVFVVQTINKQDAGEASSISYLRKTISDRAKSQTQFSLIDALKEKVSIKDNRSTFY